MADSIGIFMKPSRAISDVFWGEKIVTPFLILCHSSVSNVPPAYERAQNVPLSVPQTVLYVP